MVSRFWPYNYLGPYVSGGKFQRSVVSPAVPPVDACDACALEHDRVYAEGGDLEEADRLFHTCSRKKGFVCSVAGALVGAQGFVRGVLGNRSKRAVSSSSSRSHLARSEEAMPRTRRSHGYATRGRKRRGRRGHGDVVQLGRLRGRGDEEQEKNRAENDRKGQRGCASPSRSSWESATPQQEGFPPTQL